VTGGRSNGTVYMPQGTTASRPASDARKITAINETGATAAYAPHREQGRGHIHTQPRVNSRHQAGAKLRLFRVGLGGVWGG